MNILNRMVLLFIALPLAVAFVASAPAQQRVTQTWAARSSTGLTVGGAWTAMEDPKTGAVTGTWTVVDAKWQVVAQGGWSATKSETGWTGLWRATAVGRQGEYSGSWTATPDLKPDARLQDLFAKAVESAVGGTWQAGGQSGSWSIEVWK